MKNLFTKWGLDITATDDVIRQCYRRRAQALHPDKVGNTPKAQEEFCVLQEEYVILKDPLLRQQHIKDLSEPPPSVSPPPRPKVSQSRQIVPSSNFYIPVSPINLTLRIPLSSVSQGGVATIVFSRSKPCICGRALPCSICHGTGVVEGRSQLKLSFYEGIEQGKVMAFPQQGHQGTHEIGTVYVHILWSHMNGWEFKNNQLRKKVWVSPSLFTKKSEQPSENVIWFKTPKNTYGYFKVPDRQLPLSVIVPAGFKGVETIIDLRVSPWFRRPWDNLKQLHLALSARLLLLKKKWLSKPS